MDLEDRVGRVVLAGEQRGQLDLFGAPGQCIDGGIQLVADLLAFAGQLEQRFRLLEEPAQLRRRIDAIGQARPRLLNPLDLVRIAPDFLARQALLEGVELPCLALGIKGTSATRPPCR